jgi:site-specific recombinase XerD
MAIYKRGQVWWMSFQLENNHVQKSTKCKNKRDAETVERAYRTQLAKGEVGLEDKKPVPTFLAAMTAFLAWSKTEHAAKPNTHRCYVTSSKPLLAFFKNKPLDKIEIDDVEKYKETRSQHKSARTNRRLKPATVNRELATLKKLFYYFIEKKRLIAVNPVSGVKFPAETHSFKNILSDKDEQLYLMAASQPLQDVAVLMLQTGMRPEEVFSIERKNVNLESGYIFVPKGKTKSATRKIPLTLRAAETLHSRMQSITDDFLFINETTGKPITTLKTAHKGAVKRSGLTWFRLYDCRHTFATRFIESGGDLVTLASLLGHSNIQMVTRYAHPTEKHQFEAMKNMESVRARKIA